MFKKKRSVMNNLSFHVKELEKEEQNKSKEEGKT